MSVAYRIMNILIKNLEKGKGTKTKEDLLDMCDTYYGAGRMTDEEYTECVQRINAIQ